LHLAALGELDEDVPVRARADLAALGESETFGAASGRASASPSTRVTTAVRSPEDESGVGRLAVGLAAGVPVFGLMNVRWQAMPSISRAARPGRITRKIGRIGNERSDRTSEVHSDFGSLVPCGTGWRRV